MATSDGVKRPDVGAPLDARVAMQVELDGVVWRDAQGLLQAASATQQQHHRDGNS